MTVGTSTVLITGTAQVTVHAFFANLRTSTVSMTGTAQVTVHTFFVNRLQLLQHGVSDGTNDLGTYGDGSNDCT